MNPVVLDASVAIALVTDEPYTEAAIRDVGAAGCIVPDVFWGEAARALCRKARHGLIEPETAVTALELLDRMVDEDLPTRRMVAMAAEMSLALRHDVFDCLYLSAAMERGTVLLTADRVLHVRANAAGLGARVRLVE